MGGIGLGLLVGSGAHRGERKTLIAVSMGWIIRVAFLRDQSNLFTTGVDIASLNPAIAVDLGARPLFVAQDA